VQNHGHRHLVSEVSPKATLHSMVPSETRWRPNSSSLVYPGLISCNQVGFRFLEVSRRESVFDVATGRQPIGSLVERGNAH